MNFRYKIVIVVCLWLAFFLRIWGFNFGLPYDFHPDEHQYVEAALNWHTTGEMKVKFANPPLFTYVLIVAFWFWITLTPFEPSPDWLTNTYIFARLWSVIFGILTIALMYPFGKRLYNQKAGLLGIILMTGLFLPARESHFAVNDAILTFLTLLTVYFSLKVFKQGRIIDYLAAGLVIGLATATKLTGALVVFALLVAHGFTLIHHPDFSRKMIFAFKTHLHLWLALLAAIVTFLIVSVQIFWQFSKFIAEMYDLAQLGTQSARGGVRMGPATGWQFYIDVFGWGIGWTMFGGVLVMLGYVLFKRRLEGLILSVFPIGLFAVMGAQKLFTARYLLPAIPPLVALVAFGLVKLERHRLFLRQYQRVFWPLSLVVLLAQPLTNLIWFDYLLTLPNTQQLATDWFIKNFPEDTVVAKETYSILPNFAFINKHWPYKVINLDNSDPTRNSVQHYVSHKTQIIALSNFRFARVREDPVAEEMRLKQLAFLDEKATLIKEFSPYRRPGYEDWFYQDQLYGPAGETLQRISPGPLIKIFQLPYESQPYSLDIPDIPILTKANFGNKLMLLGYDLLTRRAEPGGSIPLTLYWQALSRMRKTYIVFNHLLNDQQQNWGGYDRWPQETANTVLWRPSEVVIDTFGIPVAADAPAGIYTIDIGLYDQADLQASPLPILMEGRQPVGQNSVTIGPVKIGGPPPGVVLSAQELEPDTLLSIELGETPTILLHGYDLTRKNDKLHLTLYWESLAQTPVDWSNFVHLRNEAGETIVQKDGPAGSGRYPTSLWDTGEIIADEIVLPVENLPGGVYHLFVGLYDLATGTRLSVPDNPANEILLQNLSF